MSSTRRVLLMAANPRDTHRVAFDEQFRRIEEEIRRSAPRGAFEIHKGGAVRPDDLLDLLNRHRPHVVHFCGHGRQGDGLLFHAPDGSALPVSAAALARAFAVLKDDIFLVVLSACYVEEQARAIAEHIEWVAGVRSVIDDADATMFAGALYRGLGFGRDVDNAFAQGQVALEMYQRRDAFVLFRDGALVAEPGAQAGTRPSAHPAAASAGSLVYTSPAAGAFELTVHLDRIDDRLEARYQHGAGGPTEPASIPWGGHGPGPALERAARILDAGRRADLDALVAGAATPDGVGPHLFAALLADDARARRVLTALSHDPQRSAPIALPVHVRVCTRDPLLAGLPWRLTAWQHRLLTDSGWRFATTHAPRPSGDYTMTVPCGVVVLAPGAAAAIVAGDTDARDADAARDAAVPAPLAPEHARDIADTLATVWRHDREQRYLRVVTTAAQLDNALRGARPDILYVCARAVARDGSRPSLVVRGDDGRPAQLALDALRAVFERAGHTPRAVYLNTAGAALDSPPLPSPNAPALVIWRRAPAWTAASTTLPRLWLESWLGHGRDPVDALHRAAAHLATSTAAAAAAGTATEAGAAAEAATVAVAADYRTWSTPRYVRRAPKDDPLSLLDRDHPKALIVKHLYELAHSPALRVLAIVGYAESGNRVDDLWSQLRATIDERGGADAAIRWHRLAFPDQRHQLAIDLEAELSEQLGRDPGETVAHLLRRHAPDARVLSPSQRPIVWLNWGVFGPGDRRQAPLTAGQLTAWLRFCSEYLTAHCPGDLRVVSYLAIETARPAAVARLLADQYRHEWIRKRSFQLDELRAETVKEKDLLKYLRDYSSCDDEIQSELSGRIMTATSGAFAATVALLETARGDRWYHLLCRLRDEQGEAAGTIDDDTTL